MQLVWTCDGSALTLFECDETGAICARSFWKYQNLSKKQELKKVPTLWHETRGKTCTCIVKKINKWVIIRGIFECSKWRRTQPRPWKLGRTQHACVARGIYEQSTGCNWPEASGPLTWPCSQSPGSCSSWSPGPSWTPALAEDSAQALCEADTPHRTNTFRGKKKKKKTQAVQRWSSTDRITFMPIER